MAVFLDRVGASSEPARQAWGPRDCSLYALALGAGFDELAFVTEQESSGSQLVYPTFVLAVMTAETENWPDPGFRTGSYDLSQLVLGQLSLVLHDSVKPTGEVSVQTRVADIHDKGSGALVMLEVRADHAQTGSPLFTATSGLFIAGEGGFGGDRGPSGAPPPPDRPPDHVFSWQTLPVQSLLYRHAGNDPNPVHTDPAFARKAGFRGPLLMGLNTLGFACRALVRTVALGDPERLRRIEARFAAPGYNGDALTAEIWTGGDLGVDQRGNAIVRFTIVNQDRVVLLDRGLATIAQPTTT